MYWVALIYWHNLQFPPTKNRQLSHPLKVNISICTYVSINSREVPCNYEKNIFCSHVASFFTVAPPATSEHGRTILFIIYIKFCLLKGALENSTMWFIVPKQHLSKLCKGTKAFAFHNYGSVPFNKAKSGFC